ncbi:transcriptional regulator DauR [Lachnospiraceae bacterium]|jgi:predicted transcriptional regulator YheO|nr:hypothetical protein [Lachnospiraceae bacterium]GFH92256.1 transcriptional regulator DauR [Lachnospiraceae bacterium]
MKLQEIQLTLIDQQILNSYCAILEGLADYLGSGYEIVLHRLDNFEHSVINIVHGEYTGRKIGAPITNKALEMLKKFNETGNSSDTYYSANTKGEPLKSTTIAIRGENNRIIGLLCMNYYMNTSFYEFINNFTLSQTPNMESSPAVETFASNVDDMILSTLEHARHQIYNDSSILSSNKNKAIINLLYEKGIFQIKDAVPKVADLLGISKNTVYMHLRNCSNT